FQAEDGIRDLIVTGVQTCALPIFHARSSALGHLRRLRFQPAGPAVSFSRRSDFHEHPARGRNQSRVTADAIGAARSDGRKPGERSEERRVGKECREQWWSEGLMKR